MIKNITKLGLASIFSLGVLVACGDKDPVEEDEKVDDVIEEQEDVQEEKQDVKEEVNKEDSNFEEENSNE